MASFFEELYCKLFSPFSRSPPSALPPPPTISFDYSEIMSSENQTYTALTSPSESAISDVAPSCDSGYFPASHRSSVSSSASSVSDRSVVLPPGVQRAKTTPAPVVPPTVSVPQTQAQIDAMSRNFPKPTDELDIDEMLGRQPHKWSLGHYVKNARDVRSPAVDKQAQTKAFEEAKKDLLRAAQEQFNLLTKRP